MTDIVARLHEGRDRVVANVFSKERPALMSIPVNQERDIDVLLQDAADTIEALRREVAELEKLWADCREMCRLIRAQQRENFDRAEALEQRVKEYDSAAYGICDSEIMRDPNLRGRARELLSEFVDIYARRGPQQS